MPVARRPSPSSFASAKCGAIVTRHGAVRGTDEHQPVAQHIAAGAGVDEIPGLQIVHPVRIGGHEDIRRGPGLDLSRQRRAGGVGEFDAAMGGGGEGRADFIQRVGERGGRQDDQIRRRLPAAAACAQVLAGSGAQQSGRQQQAGQQRATRHGQDLGHRFVALHQVLYPWEHNDRLPVRLVQAAIPSAAAITDRMGP